jgi:O-acetyl-ADP-ribose deacetylase (regulator of RNase III)
MTSAINYVTGDATRPRGEGCKVIVHCCNDIGAWGAGFVVAISARWPEPERAFLQWHREVGDLPLGEIQPVQVADDIVVVNLIGQKGIGTRDGVIPVRYEAIEAGLVRVVEFCAERVAISPSVHMPRMGCGLAGGEWHEIEAIVHRTLVASGLSVTVYDLT